MRASLCVRVRPSIRGIIGGSNKLCFAAKKHGVDAKGVCLGRV